MRDNQLEVPEGPVDEHPPPPAKMERAPQAPRNKGLLRAHPLLIGAAAILVAAASLVGAAQWWLNARHFESTDDAFIDAHQFPISAKVGGYIASVPVTDNQQVAAGVLLVQLDERDYLTAVDQAEAQVAQAEASVVNIGAQVAAQQAQVAQARDQVASAQASLRYAKQQNDRYQTLVKTGATTLQNAQQIQSQYDQASAAEHNAEDALDAANKQALALKAEQASASANVKAANALLDQTRLNLLYAKVTAAQAAMLHIFR